MSVNELKFSDNDNLASLLINPVEADLFVNLTTIGGVLDANRWKPPTPRSCRASKMSGPSISIPCAAARPPWARAACTPTAFRAPGGAARRAHRHPAGCEPDVIPQCHAISSFPPFLPPPPPSPPPPPPPPPLFLPPLGVVVERDRMSRVYDIRFAAGQDGGGHAELRHPVRGKAVWSTCRPCPRRSCRRTGIEIEGPDIFDARHDRGVGGFQRVGVQYAADGRQVDEQVGLNRMMSKLARLSLSLNLSSLTDTVSFSLTTGMTPHSAVR